MEAQKKMPEAEVSLRLAFHLIERGLVISDVHVAIDGAQIKTTDAIHFGIEDFLSALGWLTPATGDTWQGTYTHPRYRPKVIIHSRPGIGIPMHIGAYVRDRHSNAHWSLCTP